MGDRVTYALPLGILGSLAHAIAVKRDVEKIFDFSRRQHAAPFSRLSVAVQSLRIASGVRFGDLKSLYLRPKNAGRGGYAAGFSRRANSGWGNRLLSRPRRAFTPGPSRRYHRIA